MKLTGVSGLIKPVKQRFGQGKETEEQPEIRVKDVNTQPRTHLPQPEAVIPDEKPMTPLQLRNWVVQLGQDYSGLR